jgi:hypothetical protein
MFGAIAINRQAHMHVAEGKVQLNGKPVRIDGTCAEETGRPTPSRNSGGRWISRP